MAWTDPSTLIKAAYDPVTYEDWNAVADDLAYLYTNVAGVGFNAYGAGGPSAGPVIWAPSTEDFDLGGDYDDSAGKFLVPTTGYYRVTISPMLVTFSNAVACTFGFATAPDGTTWTTQKFTANGTGGTSVQLLGITFTYALTAGEYCSILANFSAGTVTIAPWGNGMSDPWWEMMLLARGS
jgi:hypothetical protein